MNSFYAYNPTKILFGPGMISRIAAELIDVRRLMLVSGQGSAARSGVLDQVRTALGNIDIVEFAGIEPNPDYTTCMPAVDKARAAGVDFVLAVGGGSVADAAKFIAMASGAASGIDPWQVVAGETPFTGKVLPVGCVQTLPASGSEMNNAFVLSHRALRRKVSYSALSLYPRFSVLDPETTRTLSPRQTALGVVDAFVHVLEQYATYPHAAPLQDRQAEAILSTLVEVGAPLLQVPDNIDLRAAVMWCAAQAVNGTLSRGVPTDWSVHAIGHELTVLYDLPHAQTLTLVLGNLYRHEIARKQVKLAQYGARVWGLSGSPADVARAAIDKTEQFFESLGVPTRLSALGLDATEVADAVVAQLGGRPFHPLGEHKAIDLDAVRAILLADS